MNGRPENYVHAWLTMESYNKTYEYHINSVRGQELWETSQYLHYLPLIRSKSRRRLSHYASKKMHMRHLLGGAKSALQQN
ncbi:hypothetical protein Ahy_B05g074875 [Arachis hypogaea]|uniref:Uncharacterized protein n=1 Tax=Arachis hypogaea TaxID=3818 RepID=A0A444Z006_ARAHY|nr:hypothetical protein Ahy_B05g074875 [Arachis hypogaea]